MSFLKPVIYTTPNKLHKYLNLLQFTTECFKRYKNVQLSKLFNVKKVTNLCRFSLWNSTSLCKCFVFEKNPSHPCEHSTTNMGPNAFLSSLGISP